MILLINICKEKLHYYEFVKPIEYILKTCKARYFIRNYKKLGKKDLDKAKKIIICGTSLKDNEYLENVEKFDWLKNIKKPVLGICVGMQIIGLVFSGKLKNKTEIGFYKEEFNKEFLGLDGKQKVYHLHNKYVEFNKNFVKFTESKIPQAVKHKKKEIYGVLFHPEVRQKHLIKNFI